MALEQLTLGPAAAVVLDQCINLVILLILLVFTP